MTAEIRDDVIVATEHVKAPPEVVLPYFTDPAPLVLWIGDRTELDARPGGLFSLDTGESLGRGAYLTVGPPRRVVFTWGIPGNETQRAPGEGAVVPVVDQSATGLPCGADPLHWPALLVALAQLWAGRPSAATSGSCRSKLRPSAPIFCATARRRLRHTFHATTTATRASRPIPNTDALWATA